MLITLDGLSGTGKSSVAKKLSEKLNLTSISSGDYFRSFAYYLDKNNIDLNTYDVNLLKNLNVKRDNERIYLNNDDITEYLKQPNINILSAKIANIKEIQDIVDSIERNLITENTIIDGRDTNVRFNNADYSFFLNASIDERKSRLNTSLNEIDSRDHYDLKGNIRKSNKLIEIDTTNKTIDEIVDEIINIIGVN